MNKHLLINYTNIVLLISISQAPIPNHRLLKNARLAPGSPGQEPQGPWQEDVLPPVLGGIMPGHRSMAKSWPWPMFDHFYPLDLIGLSWTMDFPYLFLDSLVLEKLVGLQSWRLRRELFLICGWKK